MYKAMEMGYASKLRTQEVEAGESGVQGHLDYIGRLRPIWVM